MLDEQDVVDQLLITGDLYEQILSFLASPTTATTATTTSSQILLGVPGLRDFFQTYSQFPPAAILAQCPGLEVVTTEDSKKVFRLTATTPAIQATTSALEEDELDTETDTKHNNNNNNNPFHQQQPTGELCQPPPGFLSADELLVPTDLVSSLTNHHHNIHNNTNFQDESTLPHPHTWNSALFSGGDILKSIDDDWGLPPAAAQTIAVEEDDSNKDNQHIPQEEEEEASSHSQGEEIDIANLPTVPPKEDEWIPKEEEDDDEEEISAANLQQQQQQQQPDEPLPNPPSPPRRQEPQQPPVRPPRQEDLHREEEEPMEEEEQQQQHVPQMVANELIKLPTYARLCDFLESHPEGCSASRIVRGVNGYRRFVLDFCEEKGISSSPFAATLGCCPDIECREDAQGNRRYFLRDNVSSGSSIGNHNHNKLKAGQSTAETPVQQRNDRPPQEAARHYVDTVARAIPPSNRRSSSHNNNNRSNKPRIKKPLAETPSLVEKRFVEMLRATPDGKLPFKDVRDVYDTRYDVPLDWQRLGFKSLGQMVQSFSSVVRKKNNLGGGGQLLELAPHIPSSPSHHPPVTMPGDNERIPVLLEPLGKHAALNTNAAAAPAVRVRPKKSAWDL
mmetsp:Transcript_5997/g.16849  ORF Transcript_5997/g.16849 Transcript_5997/m.16849 type:complete len:618 (-) Transcript_5997:55-1908(-)